MYDSQPTNEKAKLKFFRDMIKEDDVAKKNMQKKNTVIPQLYQLEL